MTFPAYRPLLGDLAHDSSLVCLLARKEKDTAGMGLLKMGEGRAEILSLFVRKNFRGRHIGKTLVGHLEKHPGLAGCKIICGRYNSHVPGREPLERILSSGGWSLPLSATHLYRTTRTLLRKITDMPEYRAYKNPVLTRGFTLVSWCSLGPGERDAIRRDRDKPGGWNLENSPFIEEEKIEPLTSFCIMREGEPCGWLITHRIREDTIRYTLAYLSDRVRGKRGIIVQAFIHALWRQILHGPEQACLGISSRNTALTAMVERLMIEKGLLLSHTTTLYTEKRISG